MKTEIISAAEYNARVSAADSKVRGHASDRYNKATRGRRDDLGGIYFRLDRNDATSYDSTS